MSTVDILSLLMEVVRQKPWLEQLIPNPGMFVGGDF